MTEILVSPPELRLEAEEFRQHIKKIVPAIFRLDEIITDITNSTAPFLFLGNRADSLQLRYKSQRDKIINLNQLIERFAGDLDEIASRFEKADERADLLKMPVASRIKELHYQTRLLSDQYNSKLHELYDLLDHITEADKSWLTSVVAAILALIKGNPRGMGVAGLTLIKADIDRLIVPEHRSEIDIILNELSDISAEMETKQFDLGYARLEGKDAAYLRDERAAVEILLQQTTAEIRNLESLVTGLDKQASIIFGEFTGQDSDQLLITYVKLLEQRKGYEIELSAINVRLSEAGSEN